MGLFDGFAMSEISVHVTQVVRKAAHSTSRFDRQFSTVKCIKCGRWFDRPNNNRLAERMYLCNYSIGRELLGMVAMKRCNRVL